MLSTPLTVTARQSIIKLYRNEITSSLEAGFSKLDKTNMETVYKGLYSSCVQFQTASITGSFFIDVVTELKKI
jgi:hypothetical protein